MIGSVELGHCAWPEVRSATSSKGEGNQSDGEPNHLDSGVTLLVPVGSLEQHGPHLPLDTDTRIAAAVAARAQARLGTPRVLLAPGLSYGASGEHEGFPGTISLGHEVLEQVLIEFGRSACRWADRIVFVNGHGGNMVTVVAAVRRLRYEAREVSWFPCAFPAADAHAGHTETSVLLHLSPELVDRERIEVGNCEPVGSLLAQMRSGGVAAVSTNGVLGDPRCATAQAGEQLVDAVVGDLVVAVSEWSVEDMGRLR